MRQATSRRGRRLTRIAAAAAVAAVGGCGVFNQVVDMADDAFVGDGCTRLSSRAQAQINWTRVPIVEVAVRNDEFEPMVFRLRQGRPYVLHLRNRDLERHEFAAPAFFRENAVVGIAVDGVPMADVCVESITLPARQTAVIRMVAVIDGHYEFYDTFLPLAVPQALIPAGAIVVEERPAVAGMD